MENVIEQKEDSIVSTIKKGNKISTLVQKQDNNGIHFIHEVEEKIGDKTIIQRKEFSLSF